MPEVGCELELWQARKEIARDPGRVEDALPVGLMADQRA